MSDVPLAELFKVRENNPGDVIQVTQACSGRLQVSKRYKLEAWTLKDVYHAGRVRRKVLFSGIMGNVGTIDFEPTQGTKSLDISASAALISP